MYKELNDFINERSDGDLAMFCKEIYDWHNTGDLREDSHIYKISKDFPCPSINYVEELILDRSVEQLGKIVLLLLEKRSKKFLKDFTVEK